MSSFSDASLANAIRQNHSVSLLSDQGQSAALLLNDLNLILSSGPDASAILNWLDDHPTQPAPLIRTDNLEVCHKILEARADLQVVGCTQWIWPESQAPTWDSSLEFSCATSEDLALIQSHYELASPEEILQLQKEGLIWIGRKEGVPIGFGGFHPEGSMGLLTVFEPFRNQKLGIAIERFLIGQALQQGLVPYCDVFDTNTLSLHLQKRIGMKADKPVWWIVPRMMFWLAKARTPIPSDSYINEVPL